MPERTRVHLFNGAFMLLLLFFLLPGCASQRIVEWPPIEGQVLEEGTGKPIEDAVVVALWKGTAPFTTTVCFHVESTTTDSDGRYVIPVWRNEGDWNNLDSQYVSIYAYKSSYEPSGSSGKFANVYTERKYNNTQFEWIAGPGRVDKVMSEFQGTNKERLEDLQYLGVGCGGAGISMRNLYPLDKALYEEVKQLARTNEDYERVERYRRSAARSAVAEYGDRNMTSKEMDKLIDAYIKEHLQE